MFNTDASTLLASPAAPVGLSLPHVLQPSALLSHHALNFGQKTSRPVPEFLYHLTRMLKDSANHDLIEWDTGRIIVHDPSRLETDVLGKFFRHSKYSSFQRQLNYFGFSKISGKRKMSPCSYTNEDATEDLSSLVGLKRKTVNKKSSKSTAGAGSTGAAEQGLFLPSASSSKDDIQPVNPLPAAFGLAVPSAAADESSQAAAATMTKLPPPMGLFGNQPFVARAEEYGAPGLHTSPVASIEPTAPVPSLLSSLYDSFSACSSSSTLSQASAHHQLSQITTQHRIERQQLSHQLTTRHPIAPSSSSLPQNPLLALRCQEQQQQHNFERAPLQQQQAQPHQPSGGAIEINNHESMDDTATFLALESIFGGGGGGGGGDVAQDSESSSSSEDGGSSDNDFEAYSTSSSSSSWLPDPILDLQTRASSSPFLLRR